MIERIHGHVVKGRGVGRKIGFPTFNMKYEGESMGVFAAKVYWKGGKFRAAVHIGPRPTFKDEYLMCEVHIIGYDFGDRHDEGVGDELTVELMHKIRGVQKFGSKEDLIKQIARDVEFVKNML